MERAADDIRFERFPTRVPGLDIVLNGGLAVGGVYIIKGTPGAGKTILGNQLCFNLVADGGKALYVTLLAESNARMMLNLGAMRFFNPKAIPESMFYVSAFSVLQNDGLKGVLDVIRREVRSHGAKLLVVDGLVAIEEHAPSEQEYKKFIHELQTQTALSGCTAILLASGGPRGMRPEQTMVDGLIELSDVADGQRRERRLEAAKLRGSSHLRGEHSFEITDDGITVYPRLESQYNKPTGEGPSHHRRLSIGIHALDRIIKGGLPVGSTTMVLGPPGSGKTALGLHFLSCSTAKEKGLYLGFYEPTEQATKKADAFGLPMRKLLNSGAVHHLWFPLTENILDKIGQQLLAHADAMDAQRIFIDGLAGFEYSTAGAARLLRFATALANQTRAHERTVVYTHDHPLLPPGISAVMENFIRLELDCANDKLRRRFSVVKLRDSDFDPAIRDFTITDAGIVISGLRRPKKRKP